VALREADIATKLLALASDFTLLHVVNPSVPHTLIGWNIQGQSISVFTLIVKCQNRLKFDILQ
jgi:hypothetical protein